MKKIILTFTFFVVPMFLFSQEEKPIKPEVVSEEALVDVGETVYEDIPYVANPPGDGGDESNDNYGWNKKISFFFGAGISVISNTVYELPVIDRASNNVIIEESNNLKPNVSMGIVYTPWVYNVVRKISYIDGDGDRLEKTVIEYIPRKLSFALFINPVSLSASNSNLNNTVDLGLGIGWREGNFSAFATIEFFGLKQPRDYFIEEFSTNDKQYIVGEEVQTAIDSNDHSIFKTKVMTSFGLKLAYTFDVISSFRSAASE